MDRPTFRGPFGISISKWNVFDWDLSEGFFRLQRPRWSGTCVFVFSSWSPSSLWSSRFSITSRVGRFVSSHIFVSSLFVGDSQVKILNRWLNSTGSVVLAFWRSLHWSSSFSIVAITATARRITNKKRCIAPFKRKKNENGQWPFDRNVGLPKAKKCPWNRSTSNITDRSTPRRNLLHRLLNLFHLRMSITFTCLRQRLIIIPSSARSVTICTRQAMLDTISRMPPSILRTSSSSHWRRTRRSSNRHAMLKPNRNSGMPNKARRPIEMKGHKPQRWNWAECRAMSPRSFMKQRSSKLREVFCRHWSCPWPIKTEKQPSIEQWRTPATTRNSSDRLFPTLIKFILRL